MRAHATAVHRNVLMRSVHINTHIRLRTCTRTAHARETRALALSRVHAPKSEDTSPPSLIDCERQLFTTPNPTDVGNGDQTLESKTEGSSMDLGYGFLAGMIAAFVVLCALAIIRKSISRRRMSQWLSGRTRLETAPAEMRNRSLSNRGELGAVAVLLEACVCISRFDTVALHGRASRLTASHGRIIPGILHRRFSRSSSCPLPQSSRCSQLTSTFDQPPCVFSRV